MISRLVRSAFQTGCLSVESEGLIRQILLIRGYQPTDLSALQDLWQAIAEGQIKREASATPYATAIVADVFTLLWSVLNDQQNDQYDQPTAQLNDRHDRPTEQINPPDLTTILVPSANSTLF